MAKPKKPTICEHPDRKNHARGLCISCYHRTQRKAHAKEYAKANKERLDAYRKDYYEKNKVKIKTRVAEWGKNNKEKVGKSKRKYAQNNPDVAKCGHLRRKYGITLEQKKAMIESQGSVCLICKSPNPDDVDHCHTSGRVRGVLCHGCNSGIGFFKESPIYLGKAISYVSSSPIDLEIYERNPQPTYKNQYEKCRDQQLRYRYGISFQQMLGIKTAQNGVCAICCAQPAKYVDHQHSSGAVRGILCNQCNSGLGYFKDNADYMTAAITYLENTL